MECKTTSLREGEREIDARQADGIYVRLIGLLSVNPQQIRVAVEDSKTYDSFSVEVREGEDAQHVFTHPYIYADKRMAEAQLQEVPDYAIFSD